MSNPIYTREIARHLYDFAKVIRGEAQRLDGLLCSENAIEEMNGLNRRADEVQELANRLYEAKMGINCD